MTNVVFAFTCKDGFVRDFRVPGAVFGCSQAYEEFAPERRQYEAAVAAYSADRDELMLAETLLALPGFDHADVDWHLARPGARQSAQFVAF